MKKSKLFLLFTLIPLVTPLSCKFVRKDSSASQKSFEKQDLEEEKTLSLRMSNLDKLKINYSMKAMLPKTNINRVGPHEMRHVEISLQGIDEAKANALRAAFHGESELRILPGEVYALSDFMPRFVQATVRKSFNGHFFEAPGTSNQVVINEKERQSKPGLKMDMILLSNCLSTAYEFSRANKDAFYIWMVQNEDFFDAFRKPQTYSRQLDTSELKFGDTLVVIDKDNSRPVHAATYVDENLVFEKAGISYTALYRIALMDDVRKSYPVANHEFKWIRFDRDKLPSPESFLTNVSSTGPENRVQSGSRGFVYPGGVAVGSLIRKIYYANNPKSGRFILPTEAMTNAFFENTFAE